MIGFLAGENSFERGGLGLRLQSLRSCRLLVKASARRTKLLFRASRLSAVGILAMQNSEDLITVRLLYEADTILTHSEAKLLGLSL